MKNDKTDTAVPPLPHITIGLSTSALFDMRESEEIFRTQGPEAYQQHMIANENVPFAPGHAFPLVETIRDINKALGHSLFDIVLISRNDIWTGVRAVRSCYQQDLPFSGAMFSNGRDVTPYLPAYGVDWLISTHEADVQAAAKMGIGANLIDGPFLPERALAQIEKAAAITAAPAEKAAPALTPVFNRKLHIVWDLDRVVFGPDSDDVFTEKGMEYYRHHERTKADEAISDGPFMNIARVLGTATKNFPRDNSPVISSVLTARGGESALRAMISLYKKGIPFNGVGHFSGGHVLRDGEAQPKGIYKDNILRIMREQEPNNTILFLDDSARTIDLTRKVVLSGLVPRDAGGLALGEKPPAPKP